MYAHHLKAAQCNHHNELIVLRHKVCWPMRICTRNIMRGYVFSASE